VATMASVITSATAFVSTISLENSSGPGKLTENGPVLTTG
jgi:hypothetical protein